MCVSDQQIFDLVALNAVGQKMMVSIGGKVDEKIIIYQRLRTSANIFSSKLARFLAVFTVAENCGKAFGCCGSEISKLHNVFSLRVVLLLYHILLFEARAFRKKARFLLLTIVFIPFLLYNEEK
jgi:hypothetical protein